MVSSNLKDIKKIASSAVGDSICHWDMVEGLESVLDRTRDPHRKAHGDSTPPSVGVCDTLPHEGAQVH